MNDIIINREIKITLLEVIKSGRCTEKQRALIAKAFNLFHEQTELSVNVIDDDAMREIYKLTDK